MTHTLKIPITLTEYDSMTNQRIDRMIKCYSELIEEESRAIKQKEKEAAERQARKDRAAYNRRKR